MTKITKLAEQNSLLIIPSEFPDSDDFELWASIFLHHASICNLQFELGADRHMMRFQYKNCAFNLNFEHYSESLWIAAEGLESASLIDDLALVLSL